MGDAAQVATLASETLHCVNHPQRETLLRCNKCGQPICVRCGIRTPVGIRCKSCVRMQRVPTYRVGLWHYVLAAVVALPLSAAAGWIMQFVGFFFAFFLGAAVGGLIAEIVYRLTGNRGRPLALVVCGAIVLGALAVGGLGLLGMGGLPIAGLIYAVLAVGAAYARLQ